MLYGYKIRNTEIREMTASSSINALSAEQGLKGE
jgi:hypothetical protein